MFHKIVHFRAVEFDDFIVQRFLCQAEFRITDVYLVHALDVGGNFVGVFDKPVLDAFVVVYYCIVNC